MLALALANSASAALYSATATRCLNATATWSARIEASVWVTLAYPAAVASMVALVM